MLEVFFEAGNVEGKLGFFGFEVLFLFEGLFLGLFFLFLGKDVLHLFFWRQLGKTRLLVFGHFSLQLLFHQLRLFHLFLALTASQLLLREYFLFCWLIFILTCQLLQRVTALAAS